VTKRKSCALPLLKNLNALHANKREAGDIFVLSKKEIGKRGGGTEPHLARTPMTVKKPRKKEEEKNLLRLEKI
jgi:hypothetical protein